MPWSPSTAKGVRTTVSPSFCFVFFVPFGVLAALAIRTLNQKRELATRRQDDARRGLAAAIRQELLGRLENLRLRAFSGDADTRRADGRDPEEAIVLVARYDGRRLVLPWEDQAASAEVRRILAAHPFAGLIASGETQEFVHGRSTAAASFYQRALTRWYRPGRHFLLTRAVRTGRPDHGFRPVRLFAGVSVRAATAEPLLMDQIPPHNGFTLMQESPAG